MPYRWDGQHIDSNADKNTEIIGFGEIGGIGQLVYHTVHFKEYDFDCDKQGNYFAKGICRTGCEPEIDKDDKLTGKYILESLCNLAKKIDDPSGEIPYTQLIMDWCQENAHPYAIDFIYTGLNDNNFDVNEDGFLIERDSVFYMQDFMTDLEKLYNAARFYLALEGICVADENAAYNMYGEGKYFEALPVFERFKHTAPEIPDSVYAPANGDLLKEMELENQYKAAHPELFSNDSDGIFIEEPYDHYEELRDRLIECIPDFRLRLKLNPKTNRLVFSADINSVFDIAWYTLARLLSEDPEPERKGESTPREEGILICCHHCGDFFVRRNSRQEYCDKPECQKARNAKNQREYRRRKREEKAHKK